MQPAAAGWSSLSTKTAPSPPPNLAARACTNCDGVPRLGAFVRSARTSYTSVGVRPWTNEIAAAEPPRRQ